MSDEKRTEGEPHDRLTRIADRVAASASAHVEYEGDKVIVFLNDGERGGIGLFGYDNDMDAFMDLFVHMRAIMRANGKEMVIAPLRGGEMS
jgi:hypothetical protein